MLLYFCVHAFLICSKFAVYLIIKVNHLNYIFFFSALETIEVVFPLNIFLSIKYILLLSFIIHIIGMFLCWHICFSKKMSTIHLYLFNSVFFSSPLLFFFLLHTYILSIFVLKFVSTVLKFSISELLCPSLL